jgi:hypothetical protein
MPQEELDALMSEYQDIWGEIETEEHMRAFEKWITTRI